MRAGTDYVGYVRGVLAGVPMQPRDFGEYDLRFYDDFAAMRRDILTRDDEVGLARLVAGYAWEWVSKNDRNAYDITIDGEQVRWNTRAGRLGQFEDVSRRDGIDPHDPGLRPQLRRRRHRSRPALRQSVRAGSRLIARSTTTATVRRTISSSGLTYTDEQLLEYVRNIYTVLLTRGILGTYVYVCDSALREYLRQFFARGGTVGNEPSLGL